MKVQPNPMTFEDYAKLVIEEKIRVNRDYQRKRGIWSPIAKSALIETIILGFPMPAIFLHQLYDRETRTSYRDVVDGQQRTDAITAFWSGDLRLSKTLQTERLRGSKISQINEADYQQLTTYSLPVFIFADATEANVREAFRRINSHTSTLTAEERRHSIYQGEMKWFVLGLSGNLQKILEDWSVFTKVSLIRMADAKFVSEVVYGALMGITTVKSIHLDQLYSKYEDAGSIPDPDGLRSQVLEAFDRIGKWSAVPNTPLAKHYQLSMLVLAVMHVLRAIPALSSIASGGTGLLGDDEVNSNLGVLAEALDVADQLIQEDENEDEDSDDSDEDDDEDGDIEADSVLDPRLEQHRDFVIASTSKTNTQATRTVRFTSFVRAIAKPARTRAKPSPTRKR